MEIWKGMAKGSLLLMLCLVLSLSLAGVSEDQDAGLQEKLQPQGEYCRWPQQMHGQRDAKKVRTQFYI